MNIKKNNDCSGLKHIKHIKTFELRDHITIHISDKGLKSRIYNSIRQAAQ